MRKLGFLVLALLAFGVAAYAVAVCALRPLGTFVLPEMRAADEAYAPSIHARIFVTAAVLSLGPLQLSKRLRRAISGLEFEAAYVPVAWLCWLPNLVAAELVLNRARAPNLAEA